MSTYQDMYLTLFRKVSQAIEDLQCAQRVCEQLYMEAEQGPPIKIPAPEKPGPEKA